MRGHYFLQYVLGEPMMLSPSGFMKLKTVLESEEIPKAIEGVSTANQSVVYSEIGDIAIISVDGGMYKKNMNAMCMSVASYDVMIQYIDKAESDPSIKIILFRVDTPGGFVAGADEVRERIYTSPKKTITLYENLGASGGMWIFTASDELYATPGTDLGSIGVVVAYEEQDEKEGKRSIEIVSKNAKNKRCSLNGDCKDRIQKKIDEKEEMFFKVLEENTGFNQDEIVKIFDEGGLVKAEDAKEANFIKEVIHFKPLIERLTLSRVNSASAQIKNSNKGVSMSKETYTSDKVEALEANHAEALEKITATHAEKLEKVAADFDNKMKESITAKVSLTKEIVAMAMDRGLGKETTLKMLDADDMTTAKAMLVDNMSMNSNFGGASDAAAKKDHWSEF